MDTETAKWEPFKRFYVNGAPYGVMTGNHRGFVTYGQALLTGRQGYKFFSHYLKQKVLSFWHKYNISLSFGEMDAIAEKGIEIAKIRYRK